MPLPSVRPGPQTDRVSSFRKWGMKGRTGAIHKVSKHLMVGEVKMGSVSAVASFCVQGEGGVEKAGKYAHILV